MMVRTGRRAACACLALSSASRLSPSTVMTPPAESARATAPPPAETSRSSRSTQPYTPIADADREEATPHISQRTSSNVHARSADATAATDAATAATGIDAAAEIAEATATAIATATATTTTATTAATAAAAAPAVASIRPIQVAAAVAAPASLG
eukprot:46125-Pleurochrysis_carterae.AAC.1